MRLSRFWWMVVCLGGFFVEARAQTVSPPAHPCDTLPVIANTDSLDLPPLPQTQVSLIGGIVVRLDPVRDRMTLRVFGGRDLTINFDVRTCVTQGETLTSMRDVKPGMRVLVHAAAGGVGSMAVQIARLRGATVMATCSQHNVDFVRALGAQEVFPYDQTAFEEQARDIDVVFDVIGGEAHRRSYAVIKPGGVIVALAAAPFEDQSARWGVNLATPQVLSDSAALEGIVELVAAGALKPCVEHVLPISDFAKAHQMSETGHARGKTVLVL